MNREDLLREYDALEDRIEDAAVGPFWQLADWLVDNVPEQKPGPKIGTSGYLTLGDLADRRGRSAKYLQRVRRVAAATRVDRLNDVSIRAYEAALGNSGWNLEAANERLRSGGSRLRDQSGPMMSPEALQNELGKQPANVRAGLVGNLLEDPATVASVRSDPTVARNVYAVGASNKPIPREPLPHEMTHAPRRLLNDATFALWRAYQKLQDSPPPTEELREEEMATAEKAARLAGRIVETLEGGTFDEDLAEAMAAWAE